MLENTEPFDVGPFISEEGNGNTLQFLAWEIQWTEEPSDYSPWGHKELDTI